MRKKIIKILTLPLIALTLFITTKPTKTKAEQDYALKMYEIPDSIQVEFFNAIPDIDILINGVFFNSIDEPNWNIEYTSVNVYFYTTNDDYVSYYTELDNEYIYDLGEISIYIDEYAGVNDRIWNNLGTISYMIDEITEIEIIISSDLNGYEYYSKRANSINVFDEVNVDLNEIDESSYDTYINYYYNYVYELSYNNNYENIYTLGQNNVLNNLSEYDLYTQSQYLNSFNDGISEVQTNPNYYNLYTSSQREAYGDEAYENGYNKAINDTMGNESLFKTIFDSIANVLNVKIIGNISIGGIFGGIISISVIALIVKLLIK